MAEPIASILTLTTISLAIIRKTVKFIQEAHKVDVLVKKLSTSLEDLERSIKTVASTCGHVTPKKDDPSGSVREVLCSCSDRLESVRVLVEDLASRKSGTFLQKVALKVRSDRSKKDIEQAISGIMTLMDEIHQATTCWNLQLTSSLDRRFSEVLLMKRTKIRTQLCDAAQIQAATPTYRRSSDSETMYEPECITAIRRNSTGSQNPRDSVSLNLSRSCRTQTNNSDLTILDTGNVKGDNSLGAFHYRCTACEDDDARIEEIRTNLQQHPESVVLANSTDSCQRSPLHLAAQRGNVKLARLLVEFSADINAKDSQPRSVLDLAIQHNREHFVEFLLEKGVDETAVSKQNRDRFAEMKDTIDWGKEKVRKAERKGLKKIKTGTKT